MNQVKFNRLLETSMGLVMSGVLSSMAMYLLNAPMAFKNVILG